MGGWRWNKKQTVEECLALSVFAFRKWGVLRSSTSSANGAITWRNALDEQIAKVYYGFDKYPSPVIHLTYRIQQGYQGDIRDMDYPITLTTTDCNFGGKRYWFICPLITDGIVCQRRVAKLYLPRSAVYFGCRHCHDLTYVSVQEHDSRVDKLSKDPELIAIMLNTGGVSGRLLAFKAAIKLWKRAGMW